MKILILVAGGEAFDSSHDGYPLWLSEIDGVPLLERLISGLASIADGESVFAVRASDVRQYRINNSIALLTQNAKIIEIHADTQGSACTALLAAAHIDNDEELLIVSANELVDVDFPLVLKHFRQTECDAGTLVFPSIHPRYSYVRLNDSDRVIEASQRNPISRHATVGVFWFRRGADFVAAAKSMIRKGASVDGKYYLCPAFNELLLRQRRIGVFHIDAKRYHPLKSGRQLQAFEHQVELAQF